MLPGKAYTPGDVLVLLWRRKWLVLLPALLAAAGAAWYSSRLPDQYQSETLILVVPQRVPESFVRSTVTARIEDRLRTITQQILSRTRLEPMILELDLYPDLRNRQALDDVIAHMRDQVVTTIVRGDSFRVAFTYSEPTAAMRVTDRLSREFIEDNVRERQAQAESTNQFLEAQLEDARGRLIEQEKRLEAYRREHAGELPTQLNSNLQVINSMQLQLQTLQEGINRDRDRRVVADRQLAELSAVEVVLPLPPAQPQAVAQLPTERQLEVAGQEVATLESRGLTAEHPDLRAARRKVEELSQKLADERKGITSVSPPPSVSPSEAGRRSQIAALTAELENLDRQIAAKIGEDQRLRASIAQYQARVETLPTRESELVALTRDYDTLQTAYRGLLAKKEESQIASNLENRQIGEQFRIIDPARVPERPISPNRMVINIGGLAGGLALGLLLIGVLEVRDESIKTESDVVEVLDLPVLALVPMVITTVDRRRARWRRVVAATGVVVVALSVGALIVWKGWL